MGKLESGSSWANRNQKRSIWLEQIRNKKSDVSYMFTFLEHWIFSRFLRQNHLRVVTVVAFADGLATLMVAKGHYWLLAKMSDTSDAVQTWIRGYKPSLTLKQRGFKQHLHINQTRLRQVYFMWVKCLVPSGSWASVHRYHYLLMSIPFRALPRTNPEYRPFLKNDFDLSSITN